MTDKSDITDRAVQAGRDLAYAVALLTRLPVPVDLSGASARGGAAAWAWPVAGAFVACLCGLVALLLGALGLPAGLVAGLVLGLGIVLTGAMHEDGLADAADGLWGGWDRDRRLEIMKDSRIGTYGVLALGLSLVLRWQALSVLAGADMLAAGLIAAACLGRAPMAVLMATLPPARDGGLSRSVGAPSMATAVLGVALAVLIAVLAVGPVALALASVVALAALGCGAIARAKIGGQTGDILGAAQQVSEIAALCALAAFVV